MRAPTWVVVSFLLLSPVLSLAAPAPTATGAVAPAFSLPAVHGTASLDSLRGRVVLLDFWASWCGPCRQSFPWMADLQHRLGERGLSVVAVNLDKRREAADEFLAKFPAPFAVAFDPSGGTAERYAVRVMPTSVLLDREGRVLRVHAGFDPRTAPEFARTIEEACAR